MKKPLDIEYIKECFINFYTQIIENNFLRKNDDSLHIHSNKSTLNKLSESDQGELLFDGEEIGVKTDVIDSSLSAHNTSSTCHNDLREILSDLSTRLNTLADSDDETLDQLSEVVSYIKNNKTLIDGITTSKLNVSDIINSTNAVKENTVSGKIVDALIIKELFQTISSDISSVTPEDIGASSEDHSHGDMKIITFATSEPDTVAENEIVMVYENE